MRKVFGIGFVFVLLFLGCGPWAPALLAGDTGLQEGRAAGMEVQLGEIVVTATKTPHLQQDVPVQTVVITGQQIEESSAQTVSDLLRLVPGLFVRAEDTPGISGWRTKVRGLDFNSGYGLVLIDGQRVKGGGMGEYGYGLNQIPLEMIERIEIVKGPSSVLYGSDALAGVINIITKHTPERTLYGLEAAYGTHETKKGSLYWGTKKDKLGLYFQANREESEMGQYGINTKRDEHYQLDRFDAKFSYDLTPDLDLSLQLAGEDKERKRQYLTQDTVRYQNYSKVRIAPGVKASFADGSTLHLSGYYYDWHFNTKEYGTPSGYTPTMGDMYYRDLEARFSKPFGEIHLATVGVEYLEHILDYNLADEEIGVLSGYLQDELAFNLVRPLRLVVGGRVDDHSKYGTEFCPKVSLMLEMSKQTRIRCSVGRGFKSPNIRQLYYKEPYMHGTYWYRSNPDLKAEKSWGYSLGVEQDLGQKVVLDVTLFRNDVKDMVVWEESGDTIDGLPVKDAKNVGQAYTQGVEVGCNALLFKGFSLGLSYTYLQTEDKESDKELTYNPKHNFAANLVYTYKPLGVTCSLSGQWVSKMYTNSDNTSETDSYTVVDFKISKKITSFAELSLEGNNIFDSEYGQPERDWWGPTYLVRFKMDF